MRLELHHKLALGAAVLTSGMAITDAVAHGLTGEGGPFSEEAGTTSVLVVGMVVHGLTYLALAHVLVREAPRFAGVNRVARATRCLLMGSLCVLAAAFTTVTPVTTAYDVTEGAFYYASGVVAAIAFLGLILGALVLGLALLRSRALGIGARLLALVLPVLAVTLLLQAVAPAWAHPAYLETTLQLGLALLGVGAVAQPVTRGPVAPTAAVVRD
jgi:hypothetical protein